MRNLFLNVTDSFLLNNLKAIVDKAETNSRNKGLPVNLVNELDVLDDDPLVCREGTCSAFMKSIKMNIKLLLGIFFVAVPLIAFSSITYLFNFDYSYAFVLTFIVALFSSIRMENTVHKYTQLRLSTLAY